MGLGKGLAKWPLTALALATMALTIGCGGGGSISVSNSGIDVFFSDDFSDDFDQVWVRVYRVDVVGSGGTTTVFSDPDGEVMDLAALNDGAPRFVYMGSGDVTAPQMVSIVLDRELSLIPTGGDSAISASFDLALATGDGQVTIDLTLDVRVDSGSVVVDFDLSQWTLNGGSINPVVRVGSDIGLDNGDRHEERSIRGTVNDLVGEAPDQHFRLRTHSGHSVPVITTADTVVYGPDGAESTLANGQHVLVTGVFSRPAGGFLASEIQIRGPDDHLHRLMGEAFDANFETCTFLVKLIDVRGFVPSHRIVTVLTPEGTVYLGPAGDEIRKARFYERLVAHGTKVVAEGRYDPGTNTFTAAVVKLHHEHDDRHRVETVGEVVHVDREHHSFAMAWSEWHGGPEPDSEVVRVATGDRTQFFSPDGAPIRASAFFSEVQPGAIVEVSGLFGDGVLRAAVVKVRSWGGGTDRHVAFGEVVSVHPDVWKFRLALVEWHGFHTDLRVIDVFVPEDATIVDADGNEFTRDQFFREIMPGGKVTVFGLFEEGTMTAHKIVVHRWGGDTHQARAVGTPFEWNAHEGRIWIHLIEWSGFDAHAGDKLLVLTTDRTKYFGPDGGEITKAGFFEHLTHSTILAEGVMRDGGLLAAVCKLLE